MKAARSGTRTTPRPVASSPSTSRRGCDRSSSSSRYVRITSAGRPSILRPSMRTTSSVASSAQCTSSSTRTVGWRQKHVPDRGQYLVRAAAALDELCECASGPGGDVRERTERAGREERIARSFEDMVRRPDRLAERPNERRLADAGLPGDDHEPSGAGPRLRQRGHELVQGTLSFEQLPASHSLAADGRRHGGIVRLEGSAAQGCRG